MRILTSPTIPVALTIKFLVEGLSPRGLRRRFISALRIEIARAKVAGELESPVAEELWRALPAGDSPQ